MSENDASKRIPVLVVGPPDGKSWGELTPEEAEAIAEQMAQAFLARLPTE